VRGPFRSEGEAFHFLLLTVAAFALIALASLLGGPWAGVPVWAILTITAAVFYLRRGRPGRPLKTAPAHVGAKDERRILVVANETLGDTRLTEEIDRAAAGYRKQVLVVCPALTSSLRHWASDLDAGRAQAEHRLEQTLSQLQSGGIEARGEVGDEDPLQAIEDALRTFGADEILISTHPEGRSNWLERDVVTNARERLALPITHIVIDSEAGARV
jgi:nucleotide-binding universal stress UspA family protein